MPDNIYRGKTTWDNQYNIPVLATEAGLRAPRSLTFDNTQMQSAPSGGKILRPGHLLAQLPSGRGRVFPASRVLAASTGNTIQVQDASIYRVGEAVSRVAATPQGTPSVYPGTALGTITAIDVLTDTLTLSAAATVALRDTILGDTANNPSSIVGMILSSTDVLDDLNDIAAYVSATVYGMRLPYWDTAIQNLFPEMVLFRSSLQFR